MRVLIIEDDKNKLNQVTSFLKEIHTHLEVVEKYSYNSGLKEVLMQGEFDLLLLDMSMPTFDITSTESGGRPKPFAGKEILRKLKKKRLQIPTIVITQFERFGDAENMISLKELEQELVENYSESYIATVYYNSSEDKWKNELKKIMSEEHLIE
ncbi:response regulator [Marinilactibacillus psychrotolerans]|uniref:response regulator n=1 Tax=Marinilactibacillus psychrotolerans TaxID=191770 RepID=UPI003888EA1F